MQHIKGIQADLVFVKEAHKANLESLRYWQRQLLACRRSRDMRGYKDKVHTYLDCCRGARR